LDFTSDDVLSTYHDYNFNQFIRVELRLYTLYRKKVA
jgi:hypothetical protein